MAESVMRQEMEKWLRAQTSCIAAGITLLREHYSFKRATPTIYRDNLRGLVTVDDLKIPHSELAIHQGAAGKDILVFSLTGTQTGMAVYDEGDGKCEYIFGREDEIFSHALIDQVNKMWRKVGPGGEPGEIKHEEAHFEVGDRVKIIAEGASKDREGAIVDIPYGTNLLKIHLDGDVSPSTWRPYEVEKVSYSSSSNPTEKGIGEPSLGIIGSTFDVAKGRMDWLYKNQFASFLLYRDSIDEAISDKEADKIPKTETLRPFTLDELRSLKEYADKLYYKRE